MAPSRDVKRKPSAFAPKTYKLPPRVAVMHEEPINVFASGHMSIDNIKSVYITAAINAEARMLARPPGVERERPQQQTHGAAGSEPARFGGTRTAIYARHRPAWWYGGPPLELPNKYAAYESLPPPNYFPNDKPRQPPPVPRAPSVSDTRIHFTHEADERTAPVRPLAFVKSELADKPTNIVHAPFRALTTAPSGIGHNLPAEQGMYEYFMRRPGQEEYAHGRRLQLARGMDVRNWPEPPPIDPANYAKKVDLISGTEAAILGPRPKPQHGAQPADVHEAVRRRWVKPPTAKITGEHDLRGSSAPAGGRSAHESADGLAVRTTQASPAGAVRDAAPMRDAGVAAVLAQPKPKHTAQRPSTGGGNGGAAQAEARAQDPTPVHAHTADATGARDFEPAPFATADSRRQSTPAAPVVMPQSRAIAHAGEYVHLLFADQPPTPSPPRQDTRQTFRFGEGPGHDSMAFDSIFSTAHALKDTAVTYRFGEKGVEDKNHFQDYSAVYSMAHAKKDTLSQVHFGDYVGPLGKSMLW